MKKIIPFLWILVTMSLTGYGQKPSLDHDAYDTWQSIKQTLISDDGKWVAYTVVPQQGDGWLYICDVLTGQKDSVARSDRPLFSPDSKYMAYRIIPSYDETRQAKKKKLKEDQMPKNDLEIRLLGSNDIIKVSHVKSFGLPEENSYWMAYLMEKKTDTSAVKSARVKTPDSPKKPDPKGTELVIFNPLLNKEYRFQDVTEYVVARDGKTISFLQDIPDTTKIDNYIVTVFDTAKEIVKKLFDSKGTLKKLSSDKSGNNLSFLFTADTSKVKIYDLWLSKDQGKAIRVIDSTNPAMVAGWSVSENGDLAFSDDATRLFFGSAPEPVKEPEDTLLDEEKFKLDIWSWDDDVLQPMQKKQLDQELKRTYQAVYHTDKGVMFQLADTVVPTVRLNLRKDYNIVLGSSNLKYRKYISWDSKNYSDYYTINVENGIRTSILSKTPSQVILSPSCKYVLFWDWEKRYWITVSIPGNIQKVLSVPDTIPLYDELNDTPSEPRPYGIAGWLDDEKHVLIYDRYDIWSLNVAEKEDPVNITNEYGRKNNLRLRYIKTDPEAEFIGRKETLLLSAFNFENKEAGFFSLKPEKMSDPEKIVLEKAAFSRAVTKAKKANTIIWQKEAYNLSPDLYVSDMNFGNTKKLSVTNPRQSNYNWLRAELVEWISFDKERLQGILYKPENFDPSKKYPMIVYFYERSSDGLYSYFPPAPSASIINRSFAVSNGYLLFVPDITYKKGYPGQSCYNAIVSGTYALMDRFSYIDKQKIGLDGQSWGGYQIAWLVTQTDLYKCAYAGAPVSNMISAYGGIRWESGMSRMFQYEQTQSRIGGTLWEKPVHFIENSPIFFVPKINTPLLLMHNDADGAVPWYQSIELITALRRLDKPAWLLSYNDEAHNLVKRPNRKDISIRKMQFFDHYLKGSPVPYWMKYGISQVQKGKVDGYELVKE